MCTPIPHPDGRVELALVIPARDEVKEHSGASEGTGRVIGFGFGEPEDDKRPVTNEFVDDSAVLVGCAHDALTKSADKYRQLRRIHAFCARSRVAHVDEQDGCALASSTAQVIGC